MNKKLNKHLFLNKGTGSFTWRCSSVSPCLPIVSKFTVCVYMYQVTQYLHTSNFSNLDHKEKQNKTHKHIHFCVLLIYWCFLPRGNNPFINLL